MTVARAAISSTFIDSMRITGTVSAARPRAFDEGSFGCGAGEFVDAERTHQRVMAHRVDIQIAPARDEACLWPSEQLVTAERHDVRARAQACLHGRFVGQWCDALDERGLRFEEAAAEIFRDGDVELAADGGQFFERGPR